MKVLLIQCLRGSKIGEIEIENINRERYFYYNFKKESLDKELESNGIVFLVQYKYTKEEKKQCCGMALGKYRKSGTDKLNSEKDLLKIVDIKQIKFDKGKLNIEESDEYKKIKEIIKKINYRVLNNMTHNLIEIQINHDEYNELNRLTSNTTSTKDKKPANPKIIKSYNKLERKKTLCKLAQRSIHAKRVENKGDSRKNRTEYQRDWERIIHSKSFRRLEDKAQIYTLAKGDHFRTRLTHTLEVTQIARGIARELDLNEDLVEAIALGHDLGHTPFGHVGERTLNKILQDENVEGGFKHNFQGVKVVNYLEEKYGGFEGIDLTYQVMEGILKHTKICDCDKKDDCHRVDGLKCCRNKYRVQKFLCKGDVDRLHPEYSFASTLEGQVVAVADEIAQRSHDLDDGIASGIIKENDFLDKLKKDTNLKKLNYMIEKSLNYIDDDKRNYIDDLDIKRARIVSDIITYFIMRVVKSSNKKIKRYKAIEKIKFINEHDEIVISKKLICFDKDTSKSIKSLNDITSKVIIGSDGVKQFDSKGENIIKELYKAYFENPIENMYHNTLKRITKEICRYMNDVVDVAQYKDDLDKIKKGEKDSQIISDIRKNLVKRELEIYKKQSQDEISNIKHRIFVRSIIDFIAGMTDEFAIKQFKEMYLYIGY